MEKTSNLKLLKQFLENYGEVQALNDIAVICQELSEQWFKSGDRRYGFIFADAATSIADTAHKLETAEERYAISKPNVVNSKEELQQLTQYFSNLSIKEFTALLTAREPTFVAKAKRLEQLKQESK